ncbi:MAG: hypothetical protein GQ526_06410 [Ardenticatenales bacterium]|nr:hypothetical protein [Ardenticatenales bacterium]
MFSNRCSQGVQTVLIVRVSPGDELRECAPLLQPVTDHVEWQRLLPALSIQDGRKAIRQKRLEELYGR